MRGGIGSAVPVRTPGRGRPAAAAERARLAAALLALSVFVALPGDGRAQDAGSAAPEPADTVPGRSTTVHPEAARAIGELRSPYCPGLMLEVCPSPGAAQMRDSIDLLAREGMAADSIVELMIARYGEEWRAVPRREGTGWWAWIMPPAVLLVGVLVIAVLLHRRGSAAALPGPRLEPSEADRERLRRALDDLDESEQPEW